MIKILNKVLEKILVYNSLLKEYFFEIFYSQPLIYYLDDLMVKIGKRYVLKNILGFKMILDLKDKGACRDLYHYGMREIESVNIYKNFLKKEDIVLDIGSNIGYYVLIASRATDKKIYAIEPDPRSLELLIANIKINGLEERVEIYNIAIGEKKGKAKLFQDNGYNWSRIAKGTEKGLYVKMTTLDDFLYNKKVSCLRFDLEGYEYFLLKGAQNTLQKKIKIFMEVHPFLIKEYGGKLEEMFEMLKDFTIKYYVLPEKNFFKNKSIMSLFISSLKGRVKTPWKAFNSTRTISEILLDRKMMKVFTETDWYHLFLEKTD